MSQRNVDKICRAGRLFSKETVDKMKARFRQRKQEEKREEKRVLKILRNIAEKAQELRDACPEVKDVAVLDKVSRVWFPISFLIFNILYWSVCGANLK